MALFSLSSSEALTFLPERGSGILHGLHFWAEKVDIYWDALCSKKLRVGKWAVGFLSIIARE
jgi:hypothetical protein